MTIYRFLISVFTLAIFAMIMAGCGESTDTRVIDPRSGQLTQAMSISFQPEYRNSSPTPESQTSTFGPATIANLTSQVDLFELNLTTSKPVPTISMHALIGGTTIEVGRSESTSPTTNHVVKTANSGYILSFMNDGESTRAYFYVDTRGLAGESFTLSITGAKVKVNGGNEMQLSSQNRSKTVFIQEPAKINVVQATTNTTFASAGTNDLWQNFNVTNESQTYNMFAQNFYVYANANNLTLTLNDHFGNLIGTFTHNGNGLYHLSFQVGSQSMLEILPGTTHAYQIRGNPNGNKAIQLTSLQVDAFSGTQLTGTDYVSLNRVITYP